jgi:hypothetical protein
LRDLGAAFEQYLDVYSEILPEAAVLPSLTPAQPGIASVLASYTNGIPAVFHCPNDTKYFPIEGTSYEYPAGELSGRYLPEVCRTRGAAQVWLLYDFDCFHGPAGSPGNRNVLWSDFSVRPLK